MEYLNSYEKFESMVHKKSIDQLKKISKELGAIDIGKRVSDDSFADALSGTKRDVTNTKIETYDDYIKEPFAVNQNIEKWDKRKNK